MRSHLVITLAAIAGSTPVAVAAQDAAETAVILSGTGQAQGRAQRSLGQSISASMGNAANAVAATNRARSQAPTYRPRARGSGKAGNFAIALPGDVDPLDRTDAPSYELANGASIRVSGGLRRPLPLQEVPEAAGECEGGCPDQ
ncbi:hypothetical protein ACWPM1_14355 [Tsuneonella sp. HG249]